MIITVVKRHSPNITWSSPSKIPVRRTLKVSENWINFSSKLPALFEKSQDAVLFFCYTHNDFCNIYNVHVPFLMF